MRTLGVLVSLGLLAACPGTLPQHLNRRAPTPISGALDGRALDGGSPPPDAAPPADDLAWPSAPDLAPPLLADLKLPSPDLTPVSSPDLKPPPSVVAGTVTIACYRSDDLGDRWCAAGAPPDASYALLAGTTWRIAKSAGATNALYNCVQPGGPDYMVSFDCALEGYWSVALVGHLWTTAPPGGRPIYRCHAQGDHFLSASSTCEGAAIDNGGKPIGYVLPP